LNQLPFPGEYPYYKTGVTDVKVVYKKYPNNKFDIELIKNGSTPTYLKINLGDHYNLNPIENEVSSYIISHKIYKDKTISHKNIRRKSWVEHSEGIENDIKTNKNSIQTNSWLTAGNLMKIDKNKIEIEKNKERIDEIYPICWTRSKFSNNLPDNINLPFLGAVSTNRLFETKVQDEKPAGSGWMEKRCGVLKDVKNHVNTLSHKINKINGVNGIAVVFTSTLSVSKSVIFFSLFSISFLFLAIEPIPFPLSSLFSNASILF